MIVNFKNLIPTSEVSVELETFEGRNFRVFRIFWFAKVYALKTLNQRNAKVFSREIMDNIQNGKVFSP